MLDHYHAGAYGQVHKQSWSCCGAANRHSLGCISTTPKGWVPKRLELTTPKPTDTDLMVITNIQCYPFILWYSLVRDLPAKPQTL